MGSDQFNENGVEGEIDMMKVFALILSRTVLESSKIIISLKIGFGCLQSWFDFIQLEQIERSFNRNRHLN